MTGIPQVDFCGLKVTRLILGANPFGGFSHQSKERDAAMLSYHSVARILETWERAAQAAINTIITNNETPHILQAVKEYFATGGTLQWIAQLNCLDQPDMLRAIDEAVEIGARAVYFHGWQVDETYRTGDEAKIRMWADHAHRAGVPVGTAGHAPEAHLWVDSLDAVDFHCVCFFNCGSLHAGRGEHFDLVDVFAATATIRRIQKPCIGYKIMGAGRIEARMAFEYAFSNIKPGDAVNVGMHRGDKDDMIEENAILVQEILACQEFSKIPASIMSPHAGE